MREKAIETYLRESVKRKGGMAVKQDWVSVRGAPDRLVLMAEGKVVFVELKAPGQKPKPHQERLHKKLRGLGVRVEVIDSKQQVDDLLNEIT